MTQSELHTMFELLNSSGIPFFLLRPVPNSSDITDIDLLISEENLSAFSEFILSKFPESSYKDAAYNSTVKILVHDLVLDIQFYIAFLPRKTLVLKGEVWVPSKVVLNENLNAYISESAEDQLFSLWLLRLFLDKNSMNRSNSFPLFKSLFSESWPRYLSSDFFDEWSKKIFGDDLHAAIELIKEFFEKGLHAPDEKVHKELRSYVFRNHEILTLKYTLNDLKFRLLRLVGKYNRSYPLKRLVEKRK